MGIASRGTVHCFFGGLTGADGSADELRSKKKERV